MMVADFQVYVVPPHCRASRSITQAGAKVRKPTGSSLLKISQDEIEVLETFLVGKPVKRTTTTLSAPMGRLM
jgi:hypothetical protein